MAGQIPPSLTKQATTMINNFFRFVGNFFAASPKQLYFLYINGERSPHSSFWSFPEDIEQVANSYVWEAACDSVEVTDSAGELVFVWVNEDR